MSGGEIDHHDDAIRRGAALLRRGEIVAFPTETVYGLGADATNVGAVRKIFAAKGRPSTNPLIVHVADVEIARRYAKGWDDRAEKLAQRFWPGALTIVVAKSENIVDEVTAGLATVGLRVPNHSVALKLLRAFGGAVAAPSANKSNHVSPTLAKHVMDEFGHSIPLIIDGGACSVGIESTVLELSVRPRILRPGNVSREMIEEVLGESVAYKMNVADEMKAAASPGQMAVHYAPRRPAYRFEPGEMGAVARWAAQRAGRVVLKSAGAAPEDYARQLYARLREADMEAETILVEMPPDEPAWSAVRDRLLRATRPWKLSDVSP